MSKKILITVCSVIAGLIIALLTVFFIKNSVNKNEDLSVFSSVGTAVTSETEVLPVVSEIPVDRGPELIINSPKYKTATTTEPLFTFMGTCDPLEPLILNGAEIEKDEGGVFSYTVNLNPGKNTFTFSHKGKSLTYTVNYRYVIISDYSQKTNQIYSSGSTFSVNVTARYGSTVTATFRGETITLLPVKTLQEEQNIDSATFTDYTGSFTLPTAGYQDIDLGKITFYATCNGKSESFSSGKITCKRPDFVVDYDPNATPLGGRYINVGSGKITEIIGYEAETFDAFSTDDLSRPTNNYLPKGTVDYSSQSYVYYKNDKEYAILRCGFEVYTNKKNPPSKTLTPIVSEYAGVLPDHNEVNALSFENGTDHTKLKLGVMWKAPFYFDMLPQSYTNPKTQDYTISDFTCNYIDITFCYATVFSGDVEIPEGNPLFSSAAKIVNYNDYGQIIDCTLRLYLKKQGGFYGWDASYDSEGNLVFEFLNPAKVTAAQNRYGADLTGVKILLDVGHGGIDCGALGFDYKNHSEAIQNLILAKKIKAQLESIGATVYMTRTDDSTSSSDDKITMLKRLKPNYCLAIHHDSSTNGNSNGFGSYYSQPFSKKAAEFMHMENNNTGIYNNATLKWHYYYTARSSYCPVVLTENGFMSNSNDYYNIISDSVNDTKAAAITKAIADYFLAIQ